ncbi:MAG: tetratricopeptide repeat protein [Verrucomicrobiota bacterium]
MKLITLPPLLLLSALLLGSLRAETLTSRLERGVELMERTEGLPEAIEAFQAVLAEGQESRKLTAEARYHLTDCYLRLGQTAQAEAQVEALRQGWPPENRWRQKALALLPPDSAFGPVPWGGQEFLHYEITVPNGERLGWMTSALTSSEEEGQPTWTSWMVRGSGPGALSRIEFLQDGFRPLHGECWSSTFGQLSLEVEPSGQWKTYPSQSQEILVEGPAEGDSWQAAPFYDNDQAVQLLRLLPKAIGTEVSLRLNASLLTGGLPFDFVIEAVAHERIETGLGAIESTKYETNLQQTFWIERQGPQRITQIQIGVAKILLHSQDPQWSPERPSHLQAEKLPLRLRLPAGLFSYLLADRPKIYRTRLLDGSFRFQEGLIEVQPTENFFAKLRTSEEILLDTLVENYSQNFDEGEELPGSRKILKAEGREAHLLVLSYTKGELSGQRILLAAHGDTLTTVLWFDCQPEARASVEALAGEVFTHLQIGQP